MHLHYPRNRLLQTFLPISLALSSTLAVGQSSMKTAGDNGGGRDRTLCDVTATSSGGASPQGIYKQRGAPLTLRIDSTTTWRLVPDQPGKVSFCVTPSVEAIGGTWTSPITLMLVDTREQEAPDENPDNPAVFTGLTMQPRFWSPPKTAVVAVPIAAGTRVNVVPSPAWCENNVVWYKRPELVIQTDKGAACRVRFGARDNRRIDLPTKPTTKSESLEKAPTK